MEKNRPPTRPVELMSGEKNRLAPGSALSRDDHLWPKPQQPSVNCLTPAAIGWSDHGFVDRPRPGGGRKRVIRQAAAGSGFQPAMVRAHSRASTLSVIPGNRRRSSMAADSSPSFSKMARIAAAASSETTNMAGAYDRGIDQAPVAC
jgi:hypothetical protein